MLTLYTQITEKARETFEEEISRESFPRWAAHWFTVAADFRDECTASGLTDTAKAVQALIDEQRQIVNA